MTDRMSRMEEILLLLKDMQEQIADIEERISDIENSIEEREANEQSSHSMPVILARDYSISSNAVLSNASPTVTITSISTY